MARYSSSRNSKLFKVGSLVIALVGAFSFTNVWHTLHSAGRAMAHNPVATTVLCVGVVLVLFAFRDTLLAPFGWMSPGRAERQIKAWLEPRSYSVKRESSLAKFALTATDEANRKFTIMWTTEPYAGVLVSASWGIGAELSPTWGQATPADLRHLTTRLMEVGTRLEGGGAVVTELGDAAKASVFYGTQIPRLGQLRRVLPSVDRHRGLPDHGD